MQHPSCWSLSLYPHTRKASGHSSFWRINSVSQADDKLTSKVLDKRSMGMPSQSKRVASAECHWRLSPNTPNRAEHCSLMHRQPHKLRILMPFLKAATEYCVNAVSWSKGRWLYKAPQRTAVPGLFLTTMLDLFLGISLSWTVLAKLLWQHLSLTSQKVSVNINSLIDVYSTERLISTFIVVRQ